MQPTLERLLATKIVAVVRADSGDTLVQVAQALVAGGVEAIEITFTVPGAHQIIEQVSKALGDEIVLGAGTVLDPETARVALLSGADFVVGPNTNPGVIELCRRYSKPVMPGAMTPTEVVGAWQAGADVVKVFPADQLGPGYLKALRGPLPQIRLMPTGGVDLTTLDAFLDAGACALGVGGSLVKKSWVAEGDFVSIEKQAARFREAVDRRKGL